MQTNYPCRNAANDSTIYHNNIQPMSYESHETQSLLKPNGNNIAHILTAPTIKAKGIASLASVSAPAKETAFRKTHANKNAYRKKLKIKQNRKFSSINQNPTNNIDGSLSDSDRS